MSTVIIAVLAVLAALGLGIATWLGLRQKVQSSRLASANETAGDLTAQAREESRITLLAAQEEVLKLRNETESEIKEQRRELTRLEDRHMQREEQLERKIEAQDKRQTELVERESQIEDSAKRSRNLDPNNLERWNGSPASQSMKPETPWLGAAKRTLSTIWLAGITNSSGTTRSDQTRTPARLSPSPSPIGF